MPHWIQQGLLGSVIFMKTSYFRIGLFTFVLGMSPSLIAHFSQPSNYYQAQSSPILINTEKYHLQQAVHRIKQGELEHAWSELAFVLHYFPNHPHALALLSDISVLQGQPNRAMRYFERALQLYPEEPTTYNLYGKLLLRNAKHQEAIKQFKKALLLDNINGEYHYNLSLTYFAMQNYAQASKEAQLAEAKGQDTALLKAKLHSIQTWQPTKK